MGSLEIEASQRAWWMSKRPGLLRLLFIAFVTYELHFYDVGALIFARFMVKRTQTSHKYGNYFAMQWYTPRMVRFCQHLSSNVLITIRNHKPNPVVTPTLIVKDTDHSRQQPALKGHTMWYI